MSSDHEKKKKKRVWQRKQSVPASSPTTCDPHLFRLILPAVHCSLNCAVFTSFTFFGSQSLYSLWKPASIIVPLVWRLWPKHALLLIQYIYVLFVYVLLNFMLSAGDSTTNPSMKSWLFYVFWTIMEYKAIPSILITVFVSFFDCLCSALRWP